MAGWHHRCSGHELGQTLGDHEGQGGLVCYSPWGHKASDTTGWLNNHSFPGGSDGKNQPAMQENWFQSLYIFFFILNMKIVP